MQIVADMTGYPSELLDLDLDLEADLGVDTVKQAEVFAAVRAKFGIPRDENLQLRDFPTLAHVIGFARDRGTIGVAPAVPARRRRPRTSRRPRRPAPRQAAAEPQAAPRAAPAFTGDVSAAERLPRRIPVPVLRPPAGWCKPTGVTLDETKRVVVMADEGGVGKALVKRLGALGVTTLVLRPGCAREDLESQLTGWLADGPVHGLYWLTALDAEPPLGELDLRGLAGGIAAPGEEPACRRAPPGRRRSAWAPTARSSSPRPASAATTATTRRARRRLLAVP